MTYEQWNQLPETKYIEVPAREISTHQIEIRLPVGKAVVPSTRRHDDQAAVTKATVRGLRAYYRGENYSFDAGDFAAGFQVAHLTYADGDHSNYLGNCYGPETIE